MILKSNYKKWGGGHWLDWSDLIYVTVTSVENCTIAVGLCIFSNCTMYKHTSWWWTIICSKHVEDNLIKKIRKACILVAFLMGVYHNAQFRECKFWMVSVTKIRVVWYLLKCIWWADIFSLHCIAIKSEKWIYTTNSEKLTTFHDSYKHLDLEKRVGATIHEQQHSY